MNAPAEPATPASPERVTGEVRSDVLDVLLAETETMEPLPATANKPERRNASRREHTAYWPEGTRQVARVGRLVDDSGQWTYAFESASENPSDPAVRLLPNLALEAMIDMTDGGRIGVVFIVSGNITEYDSHNYMLVRRFLLRRDDGNFQ